MSEQYKSKPQPETLLAAMAKHGITVTAEFVPWSQSRNKGEKSPSLNWRVTVCQDKAVCNPPLEPPAERRAILTTDYSAGMGHCPSYNNPDHGRPGFMSLARDAAIRHECESGTKADGRFRKTRLDGPKPADVMHSLISDSDVIDHPTYESWASDLGYDEDSRKGEAIYRACLEIALKLRAGLGESVLAELRAAAQDY